MFQQYFVGRWSGKFVRLYAAARGAGRSVHGPLMVLTLLVALVVVGSARDGLKASGDDQRLAMLDAHDLRALGFGSIRYGPIGVSRSSEQGLTVRRIAPVNVEQQNVARFIARRYQLAIDQSQNIVEYAYRTAREFKVDPLLILAVISVESSFDPKAESHQGAQGLMQILTRVHADKFAPFGGVAAAFDPLANMKVGAQILKEYLGRDGTVEGALKAYVGAALLPDDGGYGAKVLTERERIAAAARGKGDGTNGPLKGATVVSRAQTDSAARQRDI
jgi:hypothetical protein